ncbi:MAG: HD domain-containing protein [Candidatus Rokubacteria bacterium]|nr:HD domain-containing protein [Candidatus Rokubacteria bacterium]
MSDLIRGVGAFSPAPEPAPRPAGAPGTEPARRPAESAAGLRFSGPVPAAPPEPQALAEAAEGLFTELQRFLEGVRDRVDAPGPLAWDALRQLVERVVDALEEAGELFWVANRPTAPADVDYLAFHQARVAVLSVRLGANLGYERARLVELGMAACLIDVGLWKARGFLDRLEALTPEDQTRFRAHPEISAQLIGVWEPPFDGLVPAVLHHHEREQGQGFPRGLEGPAIHPDAKILGLVDTYTGLTAPPSRRPGLRPHEAVREIVRSKAESFPVGHIKALLSEISVFPPGTLVRLNTGEVGRVVAVNRNHPLRPRVEVYDAKGQALSTPKLLDLSEAPFLYITGPVSEGVR